MQQVRLVLLLWLALVGAARPSLVLSRFGERYDEAIDAIYSVTARLEALLAEPGLRVTKNFLVSPVSMAVAVGELILGAKGKLRAELHDLLVLERQHSHGNSSVRHRNSDNVHHYTLHQQLGDLLHHLRTSDNDKFVLNTSSAMFQQHDVPLTRKFRQNVSKFYRAHVYELDFSGKLAEAEAFVNKWAHDSTHGLISKLYPGGLPPNTVSVLANAVYFKARWDEPFSSELNLVRPFRVSAHESVNVTYMRGEFENYRYVKSSELNCEMAVLPYKDGQVNMYIVMPLESNGTEFDINGFSANLTSANITHLVDSAKTRKVMIYLPKMRLSSTINLLEPLKKYHKYKNLQEANAVRDIESKIQVYKNLRLNTTEEIELDMSGISEDNSFKLSSIYQQVTVNVNEEGTEAAVVSAGFVNYILDAVNFRVMRPFLFFIRHEDTEAILFWGTIVNPNEV